MCSFTCALQRRERASYSEYLNVAKSLERRDNRFMTTPNPIDAARYTVADYLTWPDEERWELIGGRAYNMSPAPSIKHQTIVGNFYSRLASHLAGNPCKPFIAPADVILSDADVVQPDVFVVCDKNKITERNVRGAPDLVIEVLSPSTSAKDLREKKALYERSGVREYLVVDPLELYVTRFNLGMNGSYGSGTVYDARETLLLQSLGGFEIALPEAFELEPLQPAVKPPPR